MLRIVFALILLCPAISKGNTLTAHCRDYPPDLYYKDGTCMGIVPDLISDIMSELGYEIDWIEVPWVRTIAWAKQGKVDLVIRHSMTEERAEYLLATSYTDTQRTVSFYQSPELAVDVKNHDDLTKLKIGVIRGMFYSPFITGLSDKRKVQLSNTEQLVKMLQAGRIDVVAATQSHNEHLFRGSFKKAPLTDTFINPMYVSLAKASKYAFLYKQLEEVMTRYKTTGKIDSYFAKYSASEFLFAENTDIK